MNLTFRSASIVDAPRMAEIRRTAILTLATSGMSGEEATLWADASGIASIEERLKMVRAWVVELEGALVVGWVSAKDNSVDGLYTLPQYACKGIGTKMLEFVEGAIISSGANSICLESSRNAEGFYLHRGYVLDGARPESGAIPMAKNILIGQ